MFVIHLDQLTTIGQSFQDCRRICQHFINWPGDDFRRMNVFPFPGALGLKRAVLSSVRRKLYLRKIPLLSNVLLVETQVRLTIVRSINSHPAGEIPFPTVQGAATSFMIVVLSLE
jgi:hypothetical protein